MPSPWIGSALAVAATATAFAAPKLPVIDGVSVLATVNGEPVSLASFEEALMTLHGEMDLVHTPDAKRPTQDPAELLERLITVKLVAQESRRMGLDQSEKFTSDASTFRRQTLERMLLEGEAAKAAEPSQEEIAQRLRILSGAVRIDTAQFPTREITEDVHRQCEEGGDFEALVRSRVEAEEAVFTSSASDWIKISEIIPALAGPIAALEPGELSAPIALEEGFALVRLVELKLPNDPSAAERAEEEAQEGARVVAVSSLVESLKKKYAKVDRELFDSLDFDARNPDLKAAEADTRVLARIEGGDPVTVADLVRGIRSKFFHGIEEAAEKKRLNVRKDGVLHETLVKRIVPIEAERRGIDRRPEFRSAVEAFEEGALFGDFVEKVIEPDVRVTEEDARKYFADHRGDYTSPEMMRLDAMVFLSRADATRALERLQNGADFVWTRQNAAGQVPRADLPRYTVYDPKFLVPKGALSAEAAGAVAGASTGDCRMYSDPVDGAHYVLWIREIIPAKPLEFEQVRVEVVRALHGERLRATLETWDGLLRKASEIRRFVDAEQLRELLRSGRPKA